MKCEQCGKGEVCACGVCHTCELGLDVSDKPDWSRLGGGFAAVKVEPRTQKVKGYVALARGGLPVPGYRILQGVGEDDQKRAEAFFASGRKIFARGAPTRPCHGFVDSRCVDDAKEALRYVDRVLAIDPGGEVLLTEWQEAIYNVLWTPTQVAIGKGHDGATSGKHALTIPLAAATGEILGKGVVANAGLAAGEDPYVEAVLTAAGAAAVEHRVLYTQVRSGPRLEGAGDFVPSRVEVAKVVVIDEAKQSTPEALLAWVDEVKGFAPGTVVYHPGGSRACHWAVHCFIHRVPYVISKRPKVGDVLEPTASGAASIDPLAVMKGIAAGSVSRASLNEASEEERTYAQAVMAIATALHNVSAFTGAAGFYLGVGAALMLRVGAAAALGEIRHERSVHHRSARLKMLGKTPLSRRQIHRRAVQELFKARRKMPVALRLFLFGTWSGDGYGGPKWAECVKAWGELEAACHALMADPGEAQVKALVEALNLAVDQVHNGGWWLNKFGLSREQFDLAAKGDPRAVVGALPLFWWAHEVTAAERAKASQAWRRAGALKMAEAAKARNDSERERLYTIAKGTYNAASECSGDEDEDDDDSPAPSSGASGDVVALHVALYNKTASSVHLHVQYKREAMGSAPYLTADIHLSGVTSSDIEALEAALADAGAEPSWSGSSRSYAVVGAEELSEGTYALDLPLKPVFEV